MLRMSIGLDNWLDENPWYQEVLDVLDDYQEGSETAALWTPWKGGLWMKERVCGIAEACAELYPGDFVEIGAYLGQTTRGLAEIARDYDRRVVVIDPWEKGTQSCQGWEYNVFLRSIEGYSDIVDVYRLSSFEDEAIEIIEGRELAFAFVDGLHIYEAALSDIKACSHCHGVIAVDDLPNCIDVWDAFMEGVEVTGRVPLWRKYHREGYLLPR